MTAPVPTRHAPMGLGRPTLEGNELDYIRQAVEAGHISCGGPFADRCRRLLSDELGAADVVLTTSCTDALEMSAMLLDLGPGDTVIVPSFTFVSTALAFARTGAKLLFCDIEPVTLGLDPQHLAELLAEPTVRAVVAVHYAGIGADLDGITEVLAHRPEVTLVEDNAHGLFGTHGGRPLGSVGRHSTLSFHETKNFVCGEGGALVLNDEADIERAWVLHDKGTNRRAFRQGEVDRYTWVDNGSSFGLAEVLAAYLYAQLERREDILASRRRAHQGYLDRLAPHARRLGLSLPTVPYDRTPAYHMFHVLLPDRRRRDAVLADLRSQEITTAFHYVPLHRSDGARQHILDTTECPVTDDVAGRLLRLPFHNRLGDADLDRVVDAFVAAVEAADLPA